MLYLFSSVVFIFVLYGYSECWYCIMCMKDDAPEISIQGADIELHKTINWTRAHRGKVIIFIGLAVKHSIDHVCFHPWTVKAFPHSILRLQASKRSKRQKIRPGTKIKMSCVCQADIEAFKSLARSLLSFVRAVISQGRWNRAWVQHPNRIFPDERDEWHCELRNNSNTQFFESC